MQLTEKRELTAAISIERRGLIDDVRRAEQEWLFAQSQFHYALGADHVDYAIYCLEAAEKKLDILLRKAKWQWNGTETLEERGGLG